MKLNGTKLIVAMFALSACGAPQYSDRTLASKVAALSKVAPNAAQKRSATRKSTGDFKGDLTQAVLLTPEYLAAQSAAAEARYLVIVSDAARKTQLVTSANAGSIVKSGGGRSSTTLKGASANLSLSRLIYDGGASVARIDSAQANSFFAETEVEIVANKIAENAGAAWIDVHNLQVREKALHALTAKAEEMLGQMETLVSSGMIDKSASTSAEIAVQSLFLEQSNLEAQISASISSYVKNFGVQPKDLRMAPSLLTASDLIKIEREWSTSPIMLQSAARVLAAKQNLLAARGGEEPTVGFKAGVVSPMDRGERTNFAIGLEMEWVLGDGGRREANTAAQAARLAAAEQTLQGFKLAGKGELDTVLSQRANLLDSMATLGVQEELSKNELKILWSQLSTGQTSVRQLIEAEVNTYRTSDRKLMAEAELSKLELAILSKSGLLAKKLGLNNQVTSTKAIK
jgi:outer membrane protein TolC